MLCRIQFRRDNNRAVVRLAGRLSAEQVPDLLEACGQTDEPPIIELDELVSADAVGIDALHRIERKRAELVGLPEYLRLTLETLTRERRR